MVLSTAAVREKLRLLDENLHVLLRDAQQVTVPEAPARDLSIVSASRLPAKTGISRADGQARLLHDLASIELQAMELGIRTLCDFPEAPLQFREDLARITRGEGDHLKLCLDALDELGYPWGTWPAHTMLWDAVSSEDSWIDRILLVHRHLEGSGLDSGESILRRLVGVEAPVAREPVERIVREEIDHVMFGSLWYREACRIEGVDPDHEFRIRMPRLVSRAPRRERLAVELRKQAGFSDREISVLQEMNSI